MREQIKELCLFMICGQTLLYFQSGKKYEKICRMILELLVLAGIVGMILNFLQSLGIQKGETQALGGAVASMQRSMEQALTRQLDMEDMKEDFITGISMESLVEKYTMEEIKSKYNYFAEQYGYEITNVRQNDDKLQVFLKEKVISEPDIEEKIENETEVLEIQRVEIEKIELGANEKAEEESKQNEEVKEAEDMEEVQTDTEQLETFRRQLALVFAMEEEKLEVILID